MPVDIQNRAAPASRGVPTDIDTLFVAMNSDTAGLALTKPVKVQSLSDFIQAGGSRTGDMVRTFDGLDGFFRGGGRQAYVGRYTDAGGLEAGLSLFGSDLGGGQVVAWDATPGDTLYADLAAFAESTKRVALLDVALDDDTVAELEAAAGNLPGANEYPDYAGLFGPWVTIPAPSGTIGGSARTIPASAVVAAQIARADARGNPNVAPAGRRYPLQYATGFAGSPISDADAASLRALGLNPLRPRFGLNQLDGFQTPIAKTDDSPFWQLNAARARMWLQWAAYEVGLEYEYATIDGEGHLLQSFRSDLQAKALQLYKAGGLYGKSPEEAFSVEVGVSVNNDDTVAQGQMNAVLEGKFSLHARDVKIELVSVPITGRVSAAA